LLWIATELGDVILDELQGGPLILQADVSSHEVEHGNWQAEKCM